MGDTFETRRWRLLERETRQKTKFRRSKFRKWAGKWKIFPVQIFLPSKSNFPTFKIQNLPLKCNTFGYHLSTPEKWIPSWDESMLNNEEWLRVNAREGTYPTRTNAPSWLGGRWWVLRRRLYSSWVSPGIPCRHRSTKGDSPPRVYFKRRLQAIKNWRLKIWRLEGVASDHPTTENLETWRLKI